MRGIFSREGRVMFLPAVVVGVAAAITGWALWGEHEQPGDLALASLIFGFVAGEMISAHDRVVARDTLVRHRAESGVRRETMRTLWAFQFAAMPLVLMLGISLVLPWRETPYGLPGYDGLTIPLFAVCLLGGVAVAAATRFAALVRPALLGIVAAPAAALAVAGILVVQPGPWTMAVVGAAIAVATGAGTVAALAGPRPARGLGAARAVAILLALLPLALGVALWARALFLDSDAWMRLGERSPIARSFGRWEVPRGLVRRIDSRGPGVTAEQFARGGSLYFVEWSYRDGRFVAVDGEGEVHASVGPEGYRLGPVPRDAERFGDPRLVARTGSRVVVTDSKRGEVCFLPLTPSRPQGFAPSHVLSLRGKNDDGPEPAPVASPARPWYRDAETPLVVRIGREFVVLSPGGRVEYRFPTESGEEVLEAGRGDRRRIATVLPRPDAAHIAVAVHAPGRERSVQRGDLSVPTRLAILFVPPALNGIAAATPVPLTLSDWFSFWWAAPDVTGGRNPGWLVGSILFGLLCGTVLARLSLRRDSDRRRALRWALAGLLLGPLAFPWQAAILPSAARETCLCGRARAVTVPACPACGAPWPAPEPTGAEVILA